MKMIFTGMILFMFILCGCSQSSSQNIPEVVKAKFASMYPKINNPDWESEDGKYEAAFRQDQIEAAVIYHADGSIFQTESEIDPTTLPQSVREYVATQLSDKKISEATKIINATGNMSFEVKVNKIDYLFDQNGQYTGIEKIEEGEKDDHK